jgi:hypothetical protein
MACSADNGPQFYFEIDSNIFTKFFRCLSIRIRNAKEAMLHNEVDTVFIYEIYSGNVDDVGHDALGPSR